MLVTLTHPIANFTGVVTVLEKYSLPFTNGTASIDLDPAAFNAVESAGIGLTIGAQAPAPPYDANLDAVVAPIVTSASSTTSAALRAALVPVGRARSRLARWKRKLASDPANAKIVVIGDSTAEETNYPWTYTRLRTYYTQSGMPLAGMTTTNIVEGGNSGVALHDWLAGSGAGMTMTDLWATNADLVIFKWLSNDARLGTYNQTQMTADLNTAISQVSTHLPNADILIATPPTFTTTVVGTDFLAAATTAQAQARADAMRRAVMSVIDSYPHVLVVDAAADVWGTRVQATSPIMNDQLHPNQTGQERWVDYIAPIIGMDRDRLANAPRNFRWETSAVVVSSGNGFIDLGTLDPTKAPAAEWPLSPSDYLYIPGFATYPLQLTGATFTQLSGNMRVLKAGTDFSTVTANTMATVVGTHPGQGVQGGRVDVTIDPPSLAAGGVADVTATLTGATVTTGVICQPPGNLPVSLLYIARTWQDTVGVRLYNPTGAAIDAPSGVWSFWLAR